MHGIAVFDRAMLRAAIGSALLPASVPDAMSTARDEATDQVPTCDRVSVIQEGSAEGGTDATDPSRGPIFRSPEAVRTRKSR